MNRKLLIVMLLTAVCAAEGCRRGGEKKPPVSVLKEGDYLYTRKTDVIGAGLDPVAKAPAGGTVTAEQQKAKQDQDAAAKKAKDDADKQKRQDDTIALGNFLLNYRQTNPATLYSFDKIKTTLRRQVQSGQTPSDMFDNLDLKKIEVVYLADTFNPKHIICYHKTVENQDDPTGKGKTIEMGHPAVFGKLGIGQGPDINFGYVKADDLTGRIHGQELQVCWYYYVQYATPHFYRAGSEFEDFKAAMQKQDPFWLPAPPPISTPPIFFGKLQQRKPELLKNPPDPRSFERFKKHLTDNAPPLLLKYAVDSTLCISMTADLTKDGLIACRSAVDTSKDQKKTNQGITANALVGAYDAEAMKGWILLNQPPKK